MIVFTIESCAEPNRNLVLPCWRNRGFGAIKYISELNTTNDSNHRQQENLDWKQYFDHCNETETLSRMFRADTRYLLLRAETVLSSS